MSETSLGALLRSSAEGRGDKPALIAGERVITYSELADRSAKVAGALHAAGVRKGDRVSVMLGNVPEFVEVLHGAWRLGAVVAPLNVMLTAEEASHVLADAQAVAVIAGPEHLPTVAQVRDRVAELDHVYVTGSGPAPSGARSYEEALRDAPQVEPAEVGEGDLALLAYTAGTTASPKGAMLSHGNLLANLEQMAGVPALAEAETDVVLLALPLFHIYALNVVLGITIKEGATAVLVERFDPLATLELVEKHRVTVLFGAPPMFAAWLEAAGQREFDLSSVRLAVSGAAALPGDVLTAFRRKLGITIWEGYGLTETAPAVTTNALGDVAKPDSIGLVLPGVELQLVDDSGQEIEEGDPGEIVIRGPNVFKGYWNKEEESESAFSDGWLRTGDIAYRDAEGYLFIVDRTKDIIIVSGFNVFPKEVEEAIGRHPKVAELAVIGVPDERTGEAVKAFVVPEPGQTLTEEEILEQCKDTLARFKWPKSIDLVDELPHHVTGKVLRRALREPPA